MSRWSDEVLDEFATRFRWEVATLEGQARWFMRDYSCEIPEGFKDAVEDAALEGILMRVRKFDEFLRGGRGRRDTDIRASDWVDDWKGEPWLDPRIRARIGWQVAHITAFGEWRVEWRPCRQVLACCEELIRFFDRIAEERPDRLAAFADAPDLCRALATDLAPLVVT